MRRYNDDEFDDRDYSHESSVDNYDMRSYARHNGYHNMDYDDKNWWQPEEEYENERYADKDDYDIAETRRRRLRPLGIRRSVDNSGRSSDYDRRNYHDSSSLRYDNNGYGSRNGNDRYSRAARAGMSKQAWQREYDYQNEGYGGRNADDYNNDYYESGYYYNPDRFNSGDVRNDNEYVYKDYSEDDGTRRRKRWSEDYDYYGSFPSYRRSDEERPEPQGNEKSWSRRNRMRERMNREDDERGRFSDRRHDFGYYTDDRYDDYPRRRPNIRDSVY